MSVKLNYHSILSGYFASNIIEDEAKLRSRLRRLNEDRIFLECLEAAGVDNWQGYDVACDEYNKILERKHNG